MIQHFHRTIKTTSGLILSANTATAIGIDMVLPEFIGTVRFMGNFDYIKVNKITIVLKPVFPAAVMVDTNTGFLARRLAPWQFDWDVSPTTLPVVEDVILRNPVHKMWDVNKPFKASFRPRGTLLYYNTTPAATGAVPSTYMAHGFGRPLGWISATSYSTVGSSVQELLYMLPIKMWYPDKVNPANAQNAYDVYVTIDWSGRNLQQG